MLATAAVGPLVLKGYEVPPTSLWHPNQRGLLREAFDIFTGAADGRRGGAGRHSSSKAHDGVLETRERERRLLLKILPNVLLQFTMHDDDEEGAPSGRPAHDGWARSSLGPRTGRAVTFKGSSRLEAALAMLDALSFSRWLNEADGETWPTIDAEILSADVRIRAICLSCVTSLVCELDGENLRVLFDQLPARQRRSHFRELYASKAGIPILLSDSIFSLLRRMRSDLAGEGGSATESKVADLFSRLTSTLSRLTLDSANSKTLGIRLPLMEVWANNALRETGEALVYSAGKKRAVNAKAFDTIFRSLSELLPLTALNASATLRLFSHPLTYTRLLFITILRHNAIALSTGGKDAPKLLLSECLFSLSSALRRCCQGPAEDASDITRSDVSSSTPAPEAVLAVRFELLGTCVHVAAWIDLVATCLRGAAWRDSGEERRGPRGMPDVGDLVKWGIMTSSAKILRLFVLPLVEILASVGDIMLSDYCEDFVVELFNEKLENVERNDATFLHRFTLLQITTAIVRDTSSTSTPLIRNIRLLRFAAPLLFLARKDPLHKIRHACLSEVSNLIGITSVRLVPTVELSQNDKQGLTVLYRIARGQYPFEDTGNTLTFLEDTLETTPDIETLKAKIISYGQRHHINCLYVSTNSRRGKSLSGFASAARRSRIEGDWPMRGPANPAKGVSDAGLPAQAALDANVALSAKPVLVDAAVGTSFSARSSGSSVLSIIELQQGEPDLVGREQSRSIVEASDEGPIVLGMQSISEPQLPQNPDDTDLFDRLLHGIPSLHLEAPPVLETSILKPPPEFTQRFLDGPIAGFDSKMSPEKAAPNTFAHAEVPTEREDPSLIFKRSERYIREAFAMLDEEIKRTEEELDGAPEFRFDSGRNADLDQILEEEEEAIREVEILSTKLGHRTLSRSAVAEAKTAGDDGRRKVHESSSSLLQEAVPSSKPSEAREVRPNQVHQIAQKQGTLKRDAATSFSYHNIAPLLTPSKNTMERSTSITDIPRRYEEKAIGTDPVVFFAENTPGPKKYGNQNISTSVDPIMSLEEIAVEDSVKGKTKIDLDAFLSGGSRPPPMRHEHTDSFSTKAIPERQVSPIPNTPSSPQSFVWTEEESSKNLPASPLADKGRDINVKVDNLDDSILRTPGPSRPPKQQSIPLVSSLADQLVPSDGAAPAIERQASVAPALDWSSTFSFGHVRPRVQVALNFLLRHLVFSSTRNNEFRYHDLYGDGLSYTGMSMVGMNMLSSVQRSGIKEAELSNYYQEQHQNEAVPEGLHPLLKEVFKLDSTLLMEICSTLVMGKFAKGAVLKQRMSLRERNRRILSGLYDIHIHLLSTSRALFKLETELGSSLTAAQAMVAVKDQITIHRVTAKDRTVQDSRMFSFSNMNFRELSSNALPNDFDMAADMSFVEWIYRLMIAVPSQPCKKGMATARDRSGQEAAVGAAAVTAQSKSKSSFKSPSGLPDVLREKSRATGSDNLLEALYAKRYIAGFLYKIDELGISGKPLGPPIAGVWAKWWAELWGPLLHLWKVPEELAAKAYYPQPSVETITQYEAANVELDFVADIKAAVQPLILNVADSVVEMLPYGFSPMPTTTLVGPMPPIPYDNFLALNTTGSNLFHLSLRSSIAANAWAGAFRLAAFEASRVNEHHTLKALAAPNMKTCWTNFNVKPFNTASGSSKHKEAHFEGPVRARLCYAPDFTDLYLVVSNKAEPPPSNSKEQSSFRKIFPLGKKKGQADGEKGSAEQSSSLKRAQFLFFASRADAHAGKPPLYIFDHVRHVYEDLTTGLAIKDNSIFIKVEGILVVTDKDRAQSKAPVTEPKSLGYPGGGFDTSDPIGDIASGLDARPRPQHFHIQLPKDPLEAGHWIVATLLAFHLDSDLQGREKEIEDGEVGILSNLGAWGLLYLSPDDIAGLAMSPETLGEVKLRFAKVFNDKCGAKRAGYLDGWNEAVKQGTSARIEYERAEIENKAKGLVDWLMKNMRDDGAASGKKSEDQTVVSPTINVTAPTAERKKADKKKRLSQISATKKQSRKSVDAKNLISASVTEETAQVAVDVAAAAKEAAEAADNDAEERSEDAESKEGDDSSEGSTEDSEEDGEDSEEDEESEEEDGEEDDEEKDEISVEEVTEAAVKAALEAKLVPTDLVLLALPVLQPNGVWIWQYQFANKDTYQPQPTSEVIGTAGAVPIDQLQASLSKKGRADGDDDDEEGDESEDDEDDESDDDEEASSDDEVLSNIGGIKDAGSVKARNSFILTGDPSWGISGETERLLAENKPKVAKGKSKANGAAEEDESDDEDGSASEEGSTESSGEEDDDEEEEDEEDDIDDPAMKQPLLGQNVMIPGLLPGMLPLQPNFGMMVPGPGMARPPSGHSGEDEEQYEEEPVRKEKFRLFAKDSLLAQLPDKTPSGELVEKRPLARPAGPLVRLDPDTLEAQERALAQRQAQAQKRESVKPSPRDTVLLAHNFEASGPLIDVPVSTKPKIEGGLLGEVDRREKEKEMLKKMGQYRPGLGASPRPPPQAGFSPGMPPVPGAFPPGMFANPYGFPYPYPSPYGGYPYPPYPYGPYPPAPGNVPPPGMPPPGMPPGMPPPPNMSPAVPPQPFPGTPMPGPTGYPISEWGETYEDPMVAYQANMLKEQWLETERMKERQRMLERGEVVPPLPYGANMPSGYDNAQGASNSPHMRPQPQERRAVKLKKESDPESSESDSESESGSDQGSAPKQGGTPLLSAKARAKPARKDSSESESESEEESSEEEVPNYNRSPQRVSRVPPGYPNPNAQRMSYAPPYGGVGGPYAGAGPNPYGHVYGVGPGGGGASNQHHRLSMMSTPGRELLGERKRPPRTVAAAAIADNSDGEDEDEDAIRQRRQKEKEQKEQAARAAEEEKKRRLRRRGVEVDD
ncbi:hypothetical protein HDU96_005465 [Phlyctochytrium bullatum]|nr:hypothetical protein HDU96_005465 [Phlyctochytrium bullatum]